jgi:hypothetical protein
MPRVRNRGWAVHFARAIAGPGRRARKRRNVRAFSTANPCQSLLKYA